MKSMRKLLTILFIILIIFSGVVYIDYFLVKTQNKLPKISIKETNGNMVVYKAIFYKVWHCVDEDKLVIGGYNDPDAICNLGIAFDDGYYVNDVGTKISESDYKLITTDQIYTDDKISVMSIEDVKNAIYVVNGYENMKYQVYREFDNMKTIYFPKYNDKTGKWEYEEEKTYYCLYNDNTYSLYVYGSGCSKDRKPFKYDDKWCELYETSTIKTFDDWNNNYCN